jgi:hypothetical protein
MMTIVRFRVDEPSTVSTFETVCTTLLPTILHFLGLRNLISLPRFGIPFALVSVRSKRKRHALGIDDQQSNDVPTVGRVIWPR